MSQHRSLTDLKNIGKKIAGRLNAVAIFCEDDLTRVGPVGAHRMIQDRYPDATLSVCYYLYSFEGALTDKHWQDVDENRKQQLQALLD